MQMRRPALLVVLAVALALAVAVAGCAGAPNSAQQTTQIAPTALPVSATAAPGAADATAQLPANPTPRDVAGQITAAIETDPVPHSGDAADDLAIWVDSTDPSRSTIIATDKQGALIVYDLTGAILHSLSDGKVNNVDIRPGFPLGGQNVALVTTSDRTDQRILIYRVDPVTRGLENVAARPIIAGGDYGACMYHSATTGKFYYFVNSARGVVEQWELFDDGTGKVDGTKVREFNVGSQTEGCVADDELGHLYIGEEAQGVWKYGAEPDAGSERAQVDTTDATGHIEPDVEGMTLYYGPNRTGYLIVSSQGNNSYVVYRRQGDNEYITTFQIKRGVIDGVSHTDGIDVTGASLGPAFPAGVFVAQDDKNDEDNQNYKLVPWEMIAQALELS
jgi:3-phytase